MAATDWKQMGCDQNIDLKDNDSISMRAWRRPAKTETALCIKLEFKFPDLDVAEVWKLTKSLESRY